MTPDNYTIKWAGMIILIGALTFWIGAFCPPYKQYMTRDIKEFLTIVYENKLKWYILHSIITLGLIISVFGIRILSVVLQPNGSGRIFLTIGDTAFFMGGIFFIINIAFRLTVMLWVAKGLTETGQLPDWYQSFLDWTNLIFGIYMVLSYFGVGCAGYALHTAGLLPLWTTWFCMTYGFAAAVLYLFRFPLFVPPLMIYLPLIITGLMMVLKIKAK